MRKVRKLILVLAFTASVLPIHAQALGLGDITVNSALNQKLDARINVLSAIPEDAEVLIIKLASAEAFANAGMDRPQVLNTLKFKTGVDAGTVFIAVTSPKPVRDPSLNLLLDVDWPKGPLIRQYSILLEPPVAMHKRTTQQATSGSNRPAMLEE